MSYSKDLENDVDHKHLVLNTFNYRIGGHTTILTVDTNTICKLAKFDELSFYQNLRHLPLDLIEYIPKYKGAIEVIEVEENSETTYYRFRDLDNGKKNNQESSMKRRNSVVKSHETFVKLENLIADLKYPCVLDIKMGTRQHDDKQALEIQQLQIDQCNKTTQGSLGAKIHGMQVYNIKESKFEKFGREIGNKITKDDFILRLKSFFFNGERYRYELINPILEKLEKLNTIFEKMNKYRFYDSSILITYDGEEKFKINGVVEPLVNTHIIDFTHVRYDKNLDDKPDEGYLFGLKNVIEKFNEIKSSTKNNY